MATLVASSNIPLAPRIAKEVAAGDSSSNSNSNENKDMASGNPKQQHLGAGAGAGAGTAEQDVLAQPQSNDLRIAMIGNVDSGKSTLVGCLTKGALDDGRGSARASVFRHRHEKENGRTSSVGVELMGFKGGSQVLLDGKPSRAVQWKEISARAERTITLIDLCGHEKYLKTTVFGLTGMMPDYCLVVVGANMGVSRMTKEHIGIAAALHLPMIVVVTKVDIAPKKVFKATMSSLSRALKTARKMPFLVRTDEDAATAVAAIAADRITPVLCISNVTGEGLDNVRNILRQVPTAAVREAARSLKPKKKDKAAKKAKAAAAAAAAATAATADGAASDTKADAKVDEAATATATATATGDSKVADADSKVDDAAAAKAKAAIKDAGDMQIDSVFQVPGVGCVVAGMVTRGNIRVGQTMLLGPSSTGEFQPVSVRSIHVHYTNVEVARSGLSAAVAIRPKNKNSKKSGSDKKRTWVRKGMSLVNPALAPASHWEFEAEILVLHHQTTLSVGYAPTLHIGVVSQTARIQAIRSAKTGADKDALRTGDRAVVRCRFMYRPEYIAPGTMLLFREGRAKGVGKIKKVL